MQSIKHSVGRFVNEKLVQPTKRLTPTEITVSVMLGILSGIFPIPLMATLAAIVLAAYIGLSAPQFALSTGINFFCTPLQVLMIPPLARACAVLTRHSVADFTISALRASLKKGGVETLKACGLMLSHALIMWLIVAVPILVVCRSLQRSIINNKMV